MSRQDFRSRKNALKKEKRVGGDTMRQRPSKRRIMLHDVNQPWVNPSINKNGLT